MGVFSGCSNGEVRNNVETTGVSTYKNWTEYTFILILGVVLAYF